MKTCLHYLILALWICTLGNLYSQQFNVPLNDSPPNHYPHSIQTVESDAVYVNKSPRSFPIYKKEQTAKKAAFNNAQTSYKPTIVLSQLGD